MQHNEYERRRRAIEEQLQADLELIRAGYQARLRALEHLWLASPGEPPPDASSVTPASIETQVVPQAEREEAQEAVPVPLQEPISSAPAQERRRGDVLADILKAFPLLPEVFDKSDVVRLLGYEPTRPSLHRVWSQLRRNKKIVIERFSDGRKPQVFRKV